MPYSLLKRLLLQGRAWILWALMTVPSLMCHAPILVWASVISREAGEASPTTIVAHGAGEYDALRPGGGSVGDGDVVHRSPLLEKYVYHETIRTDISEEHLPELGEFLESVGLQDKLEDFYRRSVLETKYLFNLNDMDLRLMDLSADEIEAVKAKVAELRAGVEMQVMKERLHPLLARRNELTYGRLFIDRSASSYEFYLAGFGPPAPLDKAPLVWAKPRNACQVSTDPKFAGTIVLAERGNCSFVEKANNVASSDAIALVIINNGENGEDLFRVAATLGVSSGVEQPPEEPKGPQSMATVMVRGSTLPSLSKALEWGPTTATLVPLDCKPGKAACEAMLPEEREADKQVDSGFIITSSGSMGVPNGKSEAFEFLSAMFGATLPRGLTAVVVALPRDACSPLSEETVETIDDIRLSAAGGAAVLDAGGRVIVVQDNSLGVLQNVGAPNPLGKELYIPGVFITARAGEHLAAAAGTARDARRGRKKETRYPPSHLTVAFHPNNTVARAWVSLGAITTWPTDLLETRVLERQLKAAHAGSPCRSMWIADKAREVQGGVPPTIEETFSMGTTEAPREL